MTSADLDELLRWEAAGGTWQRISSSAGSVELALLTCGRDEVMGRLSSREHDLIEYAATPGAQADEPPPARSVSARPT